MQMIAVARQAMATRFEIVLHGENSVALRAAGEEALDEIQRLEAHLSLYRPTSEISAVNLRAALGPVRVEPTVFRLLQHAQRLHRESAGAFDITIAPLVRCWGFMGGQGRMPDESEVAEARAKVGMDLVTLREEDFTVRFAGAGVMLDLGAIGKGYAVERAADLLREAGVNSALLHGGTSTVYAIGAPPDADSWKVAIDYPQSERDEAGLRSAVPDNFDSPPASVMSLVPLKDEAMSVSAPHGRAFTVDGRMFGHVLDPRTGWPVQDSLLAAVVLPSATETDALSTALLTLGSAGHDRIAALRPQMRTLLLTCDAASGQRRLESRGITIHPR